MRTDLVLSAWVAAATVVGVAFPANAEFPERAVTVIVTSSPGSGGDAVARTYAPFLEKCLGQGVTIVNKPGAGGALGHAEIAAAAPDGYTVGNLNMPNTVAQSIQGDTEWPLDRFDYVSNITSSRVSVNVPKDSPYQTLEDFIAYAKENPRAITLGLSSLGGDDHLTQLQLMKAAGIEMTIVPFGDGGTSRAALLGGHVSAASMSGSEAAGYQDRVRTLAIAAEERAPYLPDVPTMGELGFDVIGGSNQIIGGPKGMPEEAIAKLDQCFGEALADPEFQAQAKERALPMLYMNRADTIAFIETQGDMLKQLWESNPWINK
jgi:tripartite-type tricarboxylate transporter receptor subunit TctC